MGEDKTLEEIMDMLKNDPQLKELAKMVHEMLALFDGLSAAGKKNVINEFKDKYPDVVKILKGMMNNGQS